jgi:hypothetical protein
MGATVILTEARTVTVADADLVGSAWDVAETVTEAGVGTVAGAVYNPTLVIVPQVLAAQPTPATLQVTAVFVDPVTVAVNCCWAPTLNWALTGLMLTLTVAPLLMVTVAEADLVGSARRVAVTATMGGFGALAGAV